MAASTRSGTIDGPGMATIGRPNDSDMATILENPRACECIVASGVGVRRAAAAILVPCHVSGRRHHDGEAGIPPRRARGRGVRGVHPHRRLSPVAADLASTGGRGHRHRRLDVHRRLRGHRHRPHGGRHERRMVALRRAGPGRTDAGRRARHHDPRRLRRSGCESAHGRSGRPLGRRGDRGGRPRRAATAGAQHRGLRGRHRSGGRGPAHLPVRHGQREHAAALAAPRVVPQRLGVQQRRVLQRGGWTRPVPRRLVPQPRAGRGLHPRRHRLPGGLRAAPAMAHTARMVVAHQGLAGGDGRVAGRRHGPDPPHRVDEPGHDRQRVGGHQGAGQLLPVGHRPHGRLRHVRAGRHAQRHAAVVDPPHGHRRQRTRRPVAASRPRRSPSW